MKKPHITCRNDSLEFVFTEHEAALRRRATTWFAEKLAGASAQERERLAERMLVDGEVSALGLGVCRFVLRLHRTLRVPDDGRDYPLPAGLGKVPIRNLRTLTSPAIPNAWRGRSSALACLHRAEAMWLSFEGGSFALQVAAGGVCAVSGAPWTVLLAREPQNYMTIPEQPWLDGFRVHRDAVRQFVAMPLGKGFSVEQQVLGAETVGGLQLRVTPPHVDFLWEQHVLRSCEWRWGTLTDSRAEETVDCSFSRCTVEESGLGAGGRIRQKIYVDPHPAGTWDEAAALSCELRLIDARAWQALTGEKPTTKPPTPAQYVDAGIPWFNYESGAAELPGAAKLADVKSVATTYAEKTGLAIPANDMIKIGETVSLDGPLAGPSSQL